MMKKSTIRHITQCPSCGKDILDHMTACPFCKADVVPKGYKGKNEGNYETIRQITYIAVISIACVCVLYLLALKFIF